MNKEAVDIKPIDVIEALPALLQYILPGYLALCIYSKMTDTKYNASAQWVISGVLSYVSITALSCAFKSWEFWQITAGCLCVNVVGALIVGLIRRSVWVRDYLAEKLHITTTDATISQFVDWDEGANVAIYLKGDGGYFFVGHLRTVGDGTGDGRLCISKPSRYTPDGELLYSHEDEKTYLIVSLSDVLYLKLQ